MNKKNEKIFEIKKKSYHSPKLKRYGTFSDYTKGNGFNGNNADGQQYYGFDLTS